MKSLRFTAFIGIVFAVIFFLSGCGDSPSNISYGGSYQPQGIPVNGGGTTVAPEQETPDTSPTKGDVTGTLTYANGNPIAGALVELSLKKAAKTAAKDAAYSGETDANGVYLIKDVEHGDYVLTVTVNGTIVAQSDVSVSAEAPQNVQNVALEPEYQCVKISLVDDYNCAFLGARVVLTNIDDESKITSAVITGKTFFVDAVVSGTYSVEIPGYSPYTNYIDSNEFFNPETGDPLGTVEKVFQFNRRVIPSLTVNLTGSNLNHTYTMFSSSAFNYGKYYSASATPANGVLTFEQVPAGRYYIYTNSDYNSTPDKFTCTLDIPMNDENNVGLPVSVGYHHRVAVYVNNASASFTWAIIRDSSNRVVARPLSLDGYVYFALPDGDYSVSLPGVSTEELTITIVGEQINGYQRGMASLYFGNEPMPARAIASSFYYGGSYVTQCGESYRPWALKITTVNPLMTDEPIDTVEGIEENKIYFDYDELTGLWYSDKVMEPGYYLIDGKVVYIGGGNLDFEFYLFDMPVG